MSSVDGTCEYVLDPDDPETWGGIEGDECYVDEGVLNEDGVWTCPHESAEDGKLCIFHSPVEEKDDDEVVDAFVDVLNGISDRYSTLSECRQFQFLGTRFGEFDLSENPPEIVAKDAEIKLNHATVEDELNWYEAVFDVSAIVMSGVEFLEDASFGSEFGGMVLFGATNFEEGATFIDARFKKNAYFRSAKFEGKATFDSTEFGGAADFSSAEFKKTASFTKVDFERTTLFADVEFDKKAYFRSAKFGGEAEFANAEFGGEAEFRYADFGERTGFLSTEFVAGANFRSAEFGGATDFYEIYFGDTVIFSDAIFDEGPDFSSIESLIRGEFNGADLTDASFDNVILHSADFEDALLSRATLFGADFRGAKLSGAVLGDVRIDEDTQFLGHPDGGSDSSPHTLSAIRSKPTCVYDPDYEDENEHEDVDRAKSVYRALEELGGKHARPRLQARSFVRRQDLQKNGYKQDAKEAVSWEERLIAGARYTRAKVARATLLYGESPWRVIAWSLGIIFSFALLYPLGGWMKPTDSDPITYAQIASDPVEILNSVYYSTLTYTALGFGDFQPVGLGRLLTTLETGLGAVMLALLVFILGRRAAR